MKSTITLTFGDVAENNKGMQMIGQQVQKGEGFNLDDIKLMIEKFNMIGCETKVYRLNDAIKEIKGCENAENATLLVVKKGIQKILEKHTKYTYDDLLKEQLKLDYDKKALMYGRVVNKTARYNLCFDDIPQEPDYETGKGRIIAYSSMPVLKSLIKYFEKYFGDKFIKPHKLKCESNYYYDITKTGIGYHGDSERVKVIGVRLGESLPLHYQWYYQSKPVGQNMKFMLEGGDIYVMSEKAVGTDWKSKSFPTLRHAAGSSKFTKINE